MNKSEIKQVIITGATSMIGTELVKQALYQGISVIAVVREKSLRVGCLGVFAENPKLRVVECNIQDYGKLDFDGKSDAFFHLAWENTDITRRDDVYTHTGNITYTLDAVNAARRAGCGVFVDAGSQAEYGIVSEKLRSDTVCNPVSGYGVAKYASGKMARLIAGQLGIRYCHTRILSTYGVGMDDRTLIIYLIKTLLAGEKPSLSKCEQMWDFLYVSDTARAMLAIAENGKDGGVYPLGSGVARPLREYVESIRDIVDPAMEPGFGEKEYYPHQPMYLCADITELQSDTGFEPTVSFKEGVRMTVEWVKAQSKGRV